MRRRRWGAAALLAFVAFSGLQCVQDLIVSPPQTTYVFSLNPDSTVVNVGDTVAPFTGTLTADGRAVGFTLGFSMLEQTSVARVDSLGRLVVLDRGVARLRVRPLSVALPVDTIADTVTIWAVVPRIGLLAARTVDTLVSLGDTFQIDAAGLTRGGVPITNVPFRWRQQSGQAAITLLDSTTGRVRAEANGEAEFLIATDTATARRVVRVVQRPTTLVNTADTLKLRAIGQVWALGGTLRDARANAVTHLSPTWTSKNTGIATVAAGGQVQAVGEGTTQIIASYSGGGVSLADTTTVIVQQAQLSLLSGNAQSGTVRAALAAPLAVQIVDGVGTAIRDSGVAVIFGVTSGGGHFGAATDTLRTADTARTDAQGQARSTATLGKLVGANAFSAAGPGLVGAALTFAATGRPAPAYSIAADSGMAQTETVGHMLAEPFVVTVRDTFGNAVSGVPVRFVVTAGGGKFGGFDSVVTSTDTLGRARPRFDQLGPTATPLTLGTVAGANVVEARAAVPVGAPVVFTANGEPDVAVRLAFVVEPSDLDAGGSFSPTVEVAALDGHGNVQPNPARQVTLSLVPPAGAEGAALLGTLTVTTTGERAEFPGLTLALAAQGYRLVASAPGLPNDTSAAFTVHPGAADHLAWLVPPSTGVAGRVFGPPLQVAVLDANENRVPASADVTVEVYTVPVGGSATVFGTPTVLAADGVATFGDVGLANAGSGYRLRARAVTASGQLTVVSGYFDVRGAPASIHLVSGNDQNGAAGAALAAPFVVEVRDAAGRGVPRDTVVFQVETGGGSFGGAGSVRLVTGSDGRAAATLTLGGTSGANTATARSVSLAGQSVTFTATGVSGVLHLVFTTQPGGVALGSTFAPSPVVEVRDELNLTVTTNLRITLAITSGTGTAGAVLVGTASVDAVGGVATFPGLGVSRAGSGFTLTATAGTLGPAVSTAFAVTGTAVTIEYVSGQFQNGLVGAQLAEDFVVRVTDAAGDPVAGDTVVFKLVSQPGTGGALTAGGVTRPDTVLAQTDGQGYARARLTLGSAPGSTVATAWIARIGAPPAVGFTSSATVAGRILEFVTQPGTIQAGGAFDPPVQVRVRDEFNNTDVTATTSITLRVVGGTGLTGAFTAAAANGVATFSGVGMTQVGAGYALEAVATGLVPDTSATFDVTSGPATRLAFQGSVGTATAGTPFGATVWMVDGLGNRVMSWSGDVRAYITPERGVPGAHLSGTLTVTAANGVAQFTDLALDSAGAGYTLTFEVPEGVGLGRDTSNTFAVVPGAAARLAFAVEPSGATAGAALSPAVEARVQDALGNTVTGSNAAVTLALGDSPAGGALTGTTAVSASSGVALFTNLRIRMAGAGYTLVATATGLVPDTSGAFTVSPAPPSRLAFVQQPTDALTSAVIAPAVQVALQDSVGNVVTGDARAVSLAITSGTGTVGAVLVGTISVAVNAADGLATFGDLSIALAGTGYTLTSTADGLASAVSNGFAVLTGERRLAYVAGTPPSAVTAGQAFEVRVEIRDQSGNVIPTASDPVTLAITGGTGTAGALLRGTLTRSAVGGTATFPGLSIDSAGAGYTLTATAAEVFSATSGPVAVLPDDPAIQVFLVQPTSRTAGNVFSPAIQVALRDALGNLAATTTADVILDITAGTGAPGAALAGTRTVSTVGGVATFAGLSIAKAGTGYMLTASSAGLPPVASATFSITPGAVATVTVTPAGASISGVGGTQAFAATAQDSLGNAIASPSPAVVWTSLNPSVATADASTGVVTAVASGQVTIRAASGTAMGYALVTVVIPGATPVNLWAPMTSGTTQWLNAVWGTSGSDVYAVGNGGTILRYNGTTWSPMSSGTTRDLLGIWGASGSDITAVGPSGTLLRYNGTTWSETASGTDNMLFALWGTSGSDVYAVGLSGTIRRYDGTNWTAMASATPQNIYGIWGTSNSDIYAVARNGAIVRYNGTTWSTMTSGSTENFLDIWGTSPSDIYAAGASGSILRYNGTNWSAMTTPAALGFSGIQGTSGSDIYAVGTGGKILRYGGVTWDTMPSGTSASLQGVWGTSNSDVYAVGLDGTILRGVRGATVTVTPATPTLTALGATQQLSATVKDAASHDVPGVTGYAWSSATPAVATVDASTGVVTAVANGTAVITATVPGGASGSTTVTVSQVAKAIAVSPAGASLSGVGTTTTLTVTAQDSLGNPMPSPTVTWTSLNPDVATVDASTGVVTAVSSGQVTIAATAGGMTSYALVTVAVPGATPVNLWVAQPSGTTQSLWGVWGTSLTDVVAVGTGGTILRWDGTNWTAQASHTTQNLIDVWGTSLTDVVAVGNTGTIVRWDGTNWAAQTSNTTQWLDGVWGTSPTNVVAAGDGGTIMRWNGTRWAVEPGGATTAGLLGVWGSSPNDVFAVGWSGAIEHWNGTNWAVEPSGTSEILHGVWGTSPINVLAVGYAGTIVRWDGTSWAAQVSGTAQPLRRVWGASPTDVVAVGDGGTIVRWDGANWAAQASGTTNDLFGVWGTSTSSVYAVGDHGTILRGVRGATVAVTPATTAITALGATQQLIATAKDASDNVVSGVTGYAWSSATPAVATVDASTGVVTAVANGTAVITATAPGGASGSTTVTVAQTAKVIVVSPAGASLSGVGTTTTLTVTAQDSLGNPMPSPTVTWTSLNPNVATIDAAGIATAVSSGQVAVAATAGGVTGYALLTVAAPAATPVSLWTTASSSTGNNLLSVWAANPNDVWAVGTGGTAVHFNGTNWTGVLTRTTSSLIDVWGLGPAAVYAVGNSGVMLRYSGSAWDTLPRFTTTTDLHAIWGTSPSDLFVTAGTQIWHYNGVAWLQQATLPNGLYGLWGTSGSDVWAVGAAGMVYRYDGTTWNAASSPTSQPIFAVQGTSADEVFVVAGSAEVYRWNGASWSQLATGVSPSSWYLYDVWAATGSEVFVPGYSSTGNDGLVLRYDGSAFSTVLSNTAARLMAVGGTSGGSVFAVGPSGAIRRGIRATVTVTPGSPTLTALGTTVQLTAEVRDANGSLISGVPITWSSSDSAIAVPNGSGLVTAIGGGVATITAAAPGGASGTATVTVDIPVARVIVTPAGATITTVGATQAYAADLRDSYGNPSGGSYPVTWTSLNPTVATVDGGTGVVTGVGAGQATIAATANGMTGYALVTVAVPATTPVNLWGTVSSPTGNALSSVWVANASDAWAVGSGGTAVHFNGTSWSGVLTGTTDALNGLWGASSTEAYAVGANGRILRYGGSTWDTLPRFTTTTSLEAIWGASPKDLFVTAGTEIYHYNGTVWRSQANLPGAVNALWGTSGSDVWAVGGGGQVYRYDGTSWNQVYSPTSADIVTVWGTSPTNVYIGCHSGKAFRWDGATWNDITPPQDLTNWPWGYWDWQYVGEFWGSTPTDLYATLVHPSAVPEDWIAHYDGSSWTVVWHETTGLYALRGTSNGSVHAVGGSGRIVRGYRASIAVTPANPTITALGATLQLSGQAQDANGSTIPGVTVTWSSIDPAVATVDASTGVVTAVANGTAVITATAPGGATGSTTVTVSQTAKTVAVNPAGASLGGGSTTFTVSVQDSLGSAIASPAVSWASLNPNVATVGASTGVASAVASGQVAISATVSGITAYGVLTVAIGGATPVNLWAPMSSPTTQALWGVWARSRTEAYAVGSAGTVLRYDGSQWTSMPSNTTASLYAVSGSSSSDLHAVGSGSAVLHFDSVWHQVTSPYTDSYLDGVWAGSPVGAFAVGAYRAARYDGVQWTSMGSMTSDLMAVWGTSPANVFAVGYGGHPYRYDGTQWVEMPSPTGLPLHAVWGADSSDIFAVGNGGTVIRYGAGSWTLMAKPNLADLTAVWGTSSSDAYAVGWDGDIWRFNGTAWSAVSSPTTSPLFGVSGAPGGDVFAVGSGGAIVRGYRGATVAVAPASPTITALGATVQLAAEVRDANGALVPGVMFSWSSLDAGVATVSPSGIVTAVANGTVLIVAAAPGGVADTATVTVSQSAATQRFVAGTTHSCSLTADGTAYCWGENAYGQLGDGTTTRRATPVAVAGGLSFQALSAGSSHTCGLTTGGAAYCWGLNSFGDLGDGTTTRRTTPVAVVGGLTFRALGAGSEHTCGITTGGAAYCWGRGDVGQLGDGTSSHSTSPVAVAGELTFQALAAGSMYTCGLTTGGAGFCWGDNFYGKLGDGTTSNRASPVAVVGGLTFQALTTGADADQTCGLTAGGAAYCWGHNNEGQVGDGTTSDRTSPVVVAGGLAFQALSAGGSYLGGSTCGLAMGGAAYCWGGNTYGQLGDGTATRRTTPVAVSTTEVFESLASGSEHACGRTSGGAAYCWGHNDLDQLGAGDTLSISRTTPVAVSTSLVLQALVARSGEHTCGLTGAGAAYCWGLNTNGQLGDGTTTQRATPVAVSTAQVFHSLAIGAQHTCGLTSAGAAYCWGYNNHSQLGDGTTTQRTTPVVVNTTEVFQSLVAGSEHTCGLTSAGAAYCWGYNIHGQLGDGTTTTQTTPVAVSTAQVFQSLTAGDDHTCGLTSDGAAYCWGYNLYGRLGDGTTTQQTTPVAVSTTQLFQSLAAGSEHTCGVTSGGAAYCWGRNTYGQLGDGTTTLKTTPVAVSTAQVFQSLAAGSEHTCGATSAGAAYCWGYNLYGRLGDGTKTQRTTPVAVSTAQVFQSVAAGSGHSCGLTSGGEAYCWGWNEYGQLGLGWSGSFVTPVAVTGGIPFLAPPMAMR